MSAVTVQQLPPACCSNDSPGKSSSSAGNAETIGFATPLDAMKTGQREKLLYVVCVQNARHAQGKHDYLATIDVDESSPTYQQGVHRLKFPSVNDEAHHFGWNVCSSCHDANNVPNGVGGGGGCCAGGKLERRYLIFPTLGTDNIYIVDTKAGGVDGRAPALHKTLDGKEMRDKWNVSFLHTAHCLASGQVMISCLGDRDGNAVCTFVLLNGETFEVEGKWEQPSDNGIANFNYDFWYQPRHNVMISSEWGAPKFIKAGFNPADFANPKAYGHSLNVWNWKEKKLVKQIDLGQEGLTPLETRFFHDPNRSDGFVGTATFGSMYYFYKDAATGEYAADKIFQIPPRKVEGWAGGPVMYAAISDQVFSLDDRFMYIANFLGGEVRQYDVSEPRKARLVGMVFIGGSVCQGEGVKILEDAELKDGEQPQRPVIKGVRIEGAPNMIQLSLDGKRLYVTTSLYTPWDAQLYPDLAKKGGAVLRVNVNTDAGGLELDQNFVVNFQNEPDGPVVGHEVRYPGGDCTSDIWL